MNKVVLVVAAHPDDEVLGCGGAIARHVANGDEVFTLILGEGCTSRQDVRDPLSRVNDLEHLKECAWNANSYLGVKKVFFGDLPDNRFDSVDLLAIVKLIEKIKAEVRPDIVYTHYGNDLNIDHKLCFDAVLTATRPIAGESVKAIYSFEVLSSTEWQYFGNAFFPNIFIDISSYIDKKLEALNCYPTEMNEYPHPRSMRAVKLNAEMWGVKVGVSYAESMLLIRSLLS